MATRFLQDCSTGLWVSRGLVSVVHVPSHVDPHEAPDPVSERCAHWNQVAAARNAHGFRPLRFNVLWAKHEQWILESWRQLALFRELHLDIAVIRHAAPGHLELLEQEDEEVAENQASSDRLMLDVESWIEEMRVNWTAAWRVSKFGASFGRLFPSSICGLTCTGSSCSWGKFCIFLVGIGGSSFLLPFEAFHPISR